MNLKIAIPVVTVFLVLVAAGFLAMAQAVQTIDISTVPSFWQGFVLFVKNTVGGGAVATGVIWLVNIFGYVEAYARAKVAGNTELEYNVNKLWETTAKYLGGIALVFNIAPTVELKAVGVLILFFIDKGKSILTLIFPKK